jgi:V/A-type H+-transporting ATPase subunit C
MGDVSAAMGGRAMKYGYSNARVRAMKGLILKQAFLDELIRVNSVEAMAELLQRTGYKNDLTAASQTNSGSRLIELAASRNFSRTVKRLINVAPQSDRNGVRAMMMRWDLMNLKTLLHARRLKRGYDEMKPYLFEVGGLSDEDFRNILKVDDSNLVRELKATKLGRTMLSSGSALGKEMRSGAKADASMRLEGAIDTQVYVLMDRALIAVGGEDVGGIRRVLKREVDAKNVMIIERLKAHGISRERIESELIRGGTLDKQAIGRLLEAKDLSAIVPVLKQRFPQLEIKGEGRDALFQLEIALEKSLAAQKVAVFHRSILSAGVVIGFLLLKEEELNNLRKIAKGKEFHMPESEVRQMLILT